MLEEARKTPNECSPYVVATLTPGAVIVCVVLHLAGRMQHPHDDVVKSMCKHLLSVLEKTWDDMLAIHGRCFHGPELLSLCNQPTMHVDGLFNSCSPFSVSCALCGDPFSLWSYDGTRYGHIAVNCSEWGKNATPSPKLYVCRKCYLASSDKLGVQRCRHAMIALLDYSICCPETR